MLKIELFDVVNKDQTININSFLPADLCYNRFNKGIYDFHKQPHLFEYQNNGVYKVLGENYPYDGPVYQAGDDGAGDVLYGYWNLGEFNSIGQQKVDTCYQCSGIVKL